jgi:DNA-binding transcriptional ArsR family regulator
MPPEEKGNTKDFPKPIVSIIDALASNQRRRILMEIKEAGQLSYSDILSRTGDYKGTLNYHLKKLVSAGLLRNFLADKEVKPFTSFYEVTKIANDVIAGIIKAFEPPKPELVAIADYLNQYYYSLVSTTSGLQQVVEVTDTALSSANLTTQGKIWKTSDLSGLLVVPNQGKNKQKR